MAIPLKYNIRSLLNRKISTSLIILGIAIVAMIFVSMMALAQSMRRAIVQTGCADNVIIKNKSTSTVEYSILPEEDLQVIKYLPGIKKNSEGIPLVSPEFYSRKFIKTGEKGELKWVRVRGITPIAFEVYHDINIISGRKPKRGEIMIGKKLPIKFGYALKVGNKIKVGKQEHIIAGIFSSGGNTLEGEIWMDKEDMKLDFDLQNYSMAVVKLAYPSLVSSFIKSIEENHRLPTEDAIAEEDYYSSLDGTSTFILVMGRIIAFLMILGAILGGMNTMYTAIAGRTREIGTLRALGYTKNHLIISFIVESVVIALVGGIIGCFLSVVVNGYSLSLFEVAFSIKVEASVILQGLMLSLLIGFFGGLLPARAAVKIEIVEALRHI